jgi:NADH-quinone oxidoreductase subunit N
MNGAALIAHYLNRADYALAAPMIWLTLFGIGVLVFDLFLPRRWKHLSGILALFGLAYTAAAVVRLHLALHNTGTTGLVGFGGAITVDRFALYFFYLFVAGTVIAVLMSFRYLQIERESHGEFYALLLLATVGMFGMACGNDLILLYISLELMAITTYVLVGFLRGNRRSNEASLKYFLLGAFSSGIFAYGLSLLYGLSGSTRLPAIATRLEQIQATSPNNALVIFALVTTLAGLFFKVAAVPFHQWAPDAYEGAPTNVTGFMSVSVKAAAWVLLLRIFLFTFYPLRSMYVPLLVFVALATLTGGNLAAITQTNVKRLLAYSSIAHVGYMLLGLVASDGYASKTGIKGILVYLLVYTFMNLGAFAVIASLRRRNIVGDELQDMAGLYTKSPTSAVMMLLFLLSLAGIPPLGGFWGKYYIFLSLIESRHYTLAGIAVLYAVVGLYYYLKIANAMFMGTPTDSEPVQASLGLKTALLLSTAGTVIIGLFPNAFLRLADWSLTGFTGGGSALLR